MEVMARYGDASDVAWKVGRIMLKYRPIAPKPVTSGAVTAATVDAKSGGGRGKRKGAGPKEGRRGRKSARKSTAASYVVEAETLREDKEKYNNNTNNNNNFSSHPVVTLPLIPVTPERKEEVSSPAVTPSPTASDGQVTVSFFGRTATWRQQQQRQVNNNSNNSSGSSSSGSGSSSLVVAPRPVRPVGSWVTVECVTDTWRKGDVALALSSPAVLEKDTCPGFISDSNDRVMWTNAAYRRMVVGSADEEGEEVGAGDQGVEEEVMRVALVTRGMVPVAEEGFTCFTCRVRVQYACRGKGKVSMAAPCDVWRLADERLAWRLDVKAALSLSLGSL